MEGVDAAEPVVGAVAEVGSDADAGAPRYSGELHLGRAEGHVLPSRIRHCRGPAP